jgi:terminase large subunit-like protein
MFAKKSKTALTESVTTSLQFYSALKWLDGRPLLGTMGDYRRRLHTSALDTFDENGLPAFNFVLAGRAKKNDKSTDIALAALYKLVIPKSVQGNAGYLVANDEDQAGDDLDLIKKLIAVNPALRAELSVYKSEVRRKDGHGVLKVLPARDVAGLHGKQGNFIGFDEIHGYKNYDLFEALAPDPTRRDCLTWVSSYASIYSAPGIPLVDYFATGKAGTDPKMLFSWYSGDYTTDPDFAELPPEQRANPSMSKWVDGDKYLEQQRRRLPVHKYRRLHLNLPGAPNGAFFDQGAMLAAVVSGRKYLPPRPGIKYFAAVDMSGGSSDNCVLCIGHLEGDRVIIDLIVKQAGNSYPFDPMRAVEQFVDRIDEYDGITSVFGDTYGGDTFGFAFQKRDITFRKIKGSASDQYEAFEPRLNAGLVELLDDPTTIEEALTLVVKGARVTHESGSHDDHINAVALCVNAILDANQKRGGWFFASLGGGAGVYDSSGLVIPTRY